LKIVFINKRQPFRKHEHVNIQSEKVSDGVVVFQSSQTPKNGLPRISHSELLIRSRRDLFNPVEYQVSLFIGWLHILLRWRHLTGFDFLVYPTPNTSVIRDRHLVSESTQVEITFATVTVMALGAMMIEKTSKIPSQEQFRRNEYYSRQNRETDRHETRND
jgi:hypothetical protein